MNIDQVDSNGASLLHLAIERGDDYSAMFLLDHGAIVNGKRFLDQSTPLHLTAQHSSMTGVAEALLDQGASMEAATKLEQFIPMHLAIEKENHALFQLLLDRGSPLETPSGEGFPPLWYALLINDKAMAIQLIEKGASVNSLCDNDGNTLVHSLIKLGCQDAAIFMVENGADVNMTNRKGQGALHLSALKGLAKLAKALLEHGASPNVQTVFKSDSDYSYRQTPLHLAIEAKQTDVIDVLLESKSESPKIDLNIKNSSGT